MKECSRKHIKIYTCAMLWMSQKELLKSFSAGSCRRTYSILKICKRPLHLSQDEWTAIDINNLSKSQQRILGPYRSLSGANASQKLSIL
jgi:hypothetical protein